MKNEKLSKRILEHHIQQLFSLEIFIPNNFSDWIFESDFSANNN